jgi:hypothetical protein
VSGTRRLVGPIGFFVLTAISAFAAYEYEGKPNNPYGVQLGIGGKDFSDYANINWKWAYDLVGEWGYVRVGSGIHSGDPIEPIRTLAFCRAYKVIPVMTGLYVPEEYRDPEGGGDAEPFLRTDGYPLAADRYREWARRLAEVGAKPPFYEVGNEINGKWDPEIYGHFIIAISRALKSELPDIKVVSAGLAGNGADFLENVLREVPEAANHIDCYGLHPYAINRPPSYGKGDYCIRGYEWTARALGRVGVDDPRFVMTESGYEVGNRKDPDYPRITDELRAKYIVEAYRDWWGPDPRVVMQSLFMLQATTYPGWDGWVLVRTDCTKTKTYEALAAVEKPEGSDWMPGGGGRIHGRMTLPGGEPVERAVVYTIPGVYATVTDEGGGFLLDGLPLGEYDVHVFRDGFTTPEPAHLVLNRGDLTGGYFTSMTQIGLVPPDMGRGTGPIADGWNPAYGEPQPENYGVDTDVKRSGEGSTRLAGRPGGPVGVWQCSEYNTAVPDRAYAAEVWVKGEGLKKGDGEGVTFSLSITDPFAHPLSTAKVTLPPDVEGDFDWTPLSVTIAPYPPGRRLVLTCELDAEEGTVWFDDAYLHYADYPVPSREEMAKSGPGRITGEVMGIGEHDDEDGLGERQGNAIVWLRPGNYWTRTSLDGTFEVSGIPSGVYDVWASARGWASGVEYSVNLQAEPVVVDVVLPKLSAPRKVQNAGFEIAGLEMADVPHWTRYGEFDGRSENGWHAGIGIPNHEDGIRSHSGEAFAGCVSGSNVKNGGLYQTLETDPGVTYQAGVWVYTYQTEDGLRGDVACRLGLDPTGGTDPEGDYVLWTPWRPSHGAWTHIALKAVANSNRMTLFLGSKQVQGIVFSVNVFDDVMFRQSPEPLSAPQAIVSPE